MIIEITGVVCAILLQYLNISYQTVPVGR